MKILLCVIFKDDSEIEYAENMLKSFMPYMAGLCVTITGTSGQHEKLIKLIESYNGVYEVKTPENAPKLYHEGKFANFAEARNLNFELADKQTGYDWYFWADIDDVLIGGEELQTIAERAKKGNIDAVFLTYWYSVQVRDDGTYTENDVVIDHLRERLLKPGVFKWVSRLHEISVAKDEKYKPINIEYGYNGNEDRNLVVVHLTDDKRIQDNSERNRDILELQMIDEEGKDPRTIFYLSKTYFDLKDEKNYPKCLELLEKYRELSGWEEERASSWEYTANIYAKMGKHKEAVDALHAAAKEFPSRHMIYLLLAREYGELGVLDKSHFWLETALKMDPPSTRTTIGNPLEIKYFAASLKYNEAMRRQDLDDAIKWLKTRNHLANAKDDGLIEALEEAKKLNKAAIDVFNYAKWLKDNNYTSHVQKLLESLPFELGREAFASYLSNEVNEPKVWDDKSIVYYASWGVEHFEDWSPKNMDKGIGGSETAVIELAKQWVKLGYKVTVFGDPRDDAGVHDGVDYRPWYEINWKDTFNILILWRSPHLLDRDIKAKKVFMDLHDVVSQLDYTEERMKKLDGVFFKSKYHRNMVPKLPNDKAFIISNGIEL